MKPSWFLLPLILFFSVNAVAREQPGEVTKYLMAAEQGNLHAERALYEMSDQGKRDIAFTELTQTIKILFSLLLFFPVWWLIAGYFFNSPPTHFNIIIIVTFVGGVIGFFIAFACNGGAGGSSEMSASAWSCFIPYMAIHNVVLAFIFFSGQRKRES